MCWRSSPKGEQEGRSFPVGQLAPLAAIKGVRLVSLQKQGDTAEREAIAASGVEQLCEFDDATGFLEAAALVTVCDLVISTDTSMIHLAGALNRPAWMPKPPHGDWRWLLNRSDTPWYPNTTLFRQTTMDDWDEVFVRVRQALETLVATLERECGERPGPRRASRLRPPT